MSKTVLGTVLLVVATACGGSTEPPSVVGIYDLRSIDGASLPVPILAPWRATGGSFGLEPNGEFAMSIATESNGAPGPIMGWAGTYTRTGSQIVLTAHLSPGTSGETIPGTVEGKTVTLRYDLEFGTDAQDDDERLLFTFVR